MCHFLSDCSERWTNIDKGRDFFFFKKNVLLVGNRLARFVGKKEPLDRSQAVAGWGNKKCRHIGEKMKIILKSSLKRGEDWIALDIQYLPYTPGLK